MMYQILENEEEIVAAQQAFIDNLKIVKPRRVVNQLIRHAGGDHYPETVFYFDTLGFWARIKKGFEDFGEGRYWNVFGVGSPFGREYLKITVELNYHPIDYSPRCGGAIAKDDKGKLHLLHNGIVNGVTKLKFLNSFPNSIVSAVSSEYSGEYVDIGVLDANVAQSIAAFIHKVDKIKKETF